MEKIFLLFLVFATTIFANSKWVRVDCKGYQNDIYDKNAVDISGYLKVTLVDSRIGSRTYDADGVLDFTFKPYKKPYSKKSFTVEGTYQAYSEYQETELYLIDTKSPPPILKIFLSNYVKLFSKIRLKDGSQYGTDCRSSLKE